MATARKCDRCGKYYDENSRYNLHGEKLIGIRFVSVTYKTERFDLCDDCLHELRLFIGIKSIEEKEKCGC